MNTEKENGGRFNLFPLAVLAVAAVVVALIAGDEYGRGFLRGLFCIGYWKQP